MAADDGEGQALALRVDMTGGQVDSYSPGREL